MEVYTFSSFILRFSFGFGWLNLFHAISKHILLGTEIPRSEGRGRLYLTLHCHHQNDSCIKMGSDDESHVNVLLVVSDSHKTVHKPQLLKREESSRSFCLPA